jgi:class 3 adenylate cyclase
MFADLVDYVRMVAELDPEDVQERVSHALDAMAGAVERFGGTREKFIGDAIFAVFGWPVARDDDAVRASLCALAIRAALSDLPGGHPFEVRIGVSTGEVVTASGSGPLEENRLTGPAIVTAARIQSLARAGEIVVDAATVEAARSRVGVTDRGTVILRGHAEPVHLFAVERATGFDTWTKPRASQGSPLVGRVDELRILAAAIERCATAGSGSVVLVEGEPGIGKSRLLAEAESIARAAGLGWTWTENVSYGAVEPYRFARVLAQALADEHGVDSGRFARQMLFTADVDPAVARRYGGAIAAVAQEAEFGGWEAEASDMPEDPAEVTATLTEVADQYIRRVIETDGPRVIVIDDLHWIDQSSEAMADLLVELTTTLPLVIFAAQRPGPQRSWAGNAHVARLRLGGLLIRESGQLATHVARAALDADGARQIHERTGGNPLFVTETVRAFLADGTLAVHDGRLRLVDRGPLAVPLTLRAILGARIDALGHQARELLGVAAVIGMRFRTGMAERLVDVEIGAAAVHELADSAFIVPLEGDVWRFGHNLIRDTAYSGLLASRRRELHGRVADELEREEPAPSLARIARHRAAAGDRDRALPLLDQAADLAMAVGAVIEAAGFWREAADLSPDPDVANAYRRRAAEAIAAVAPPLSS